jgi:hypothetical protein
MESILRIDLGLSAISWCRTLIRKLKLLERIQILLRANSLFLNRSIAQTLDKYLIFLGLTGKSVSSSNNRSKGREISMILV